MSNRYYSYVVEGGEHSIMGLVSAPLSGYVEQWAREMFFTRHGFRASTCKVRLGDFT